MHQGFCLIGTPWIDSPPGRNQWLFPVCSCRTCCWTPRDPTPRLACTPSSSAKASRSNPNQSRKSSKRPPKSLHAATWCFECNRSVSPSRRCNSEVKYDSDRHFRDQVHCALFPTPTSYSETVVAVRDCTWRSYKSEVHLEPRQKPVSYRSTTIIYPKHAKSTYRTTLRYNSGSSRRWFVSTVQLESSEDTSPCVLYAEDL